MEGILTYSLCCVDTAVWIHACKRELDGGLQKQGVPRSCIEVCDKEIVQGEKLKDLYHVHMH